MLCTRFDQTLAKSMLDSVRNRNASGTGKGECQEDGKEKMRTSSTHLASAADTFNVVGFVNHR